jgi:two-component system NarL family sensor kinase
LVELSALEVDTEECERDAARRLQGLLRVARDVNSSLELPVVLDRILSCALEIMSAEGGSIMLMEPENGTLRVVAAHGPRGRDILGKSQSLEEGVGGWVTVHGQPVLLHGGASDRRFVRICERLDLRDAMCAPLRVEGHVLGAINLNNRLRTRPFGDEDLELLVALANQAAVAIRNAESFAEMRRQRQTVERLLSEVNRAQVEERKRIALQLHDGPAQTMYAALRNLEAARVMLAEMEPGAKAVYEELERTIRASIDETRAVMLDLRPPVLDEWGLDSALRQYAQQFEKRTGIRTLGLRKGAAVRLPTQMESCLYRIVQEALTNVWKHAEARNARVTLEVGPYACQLEIVDDGKGFDPDAAVAEEAEHLGLMSLRDRAQLVGGRLSVTCRPGRGARIVVSAPLADQGDRA